MNSDRKKEIMICMNQLNCYKEKHRVTQDVVLCLNYVTTLTPTVSLFSKNFK
jgi:hypothetical protein